MSGITKGGNYIVQGGLSDVDVRRLTMTSEARLPDTWQTKTTETEAAVDRVERRMADRRRAAREAWVVIELIAIGARTSVSATLFAAEADARAFFNASTYDKFLKKETVR